MCIQCVQFIFVERVHEIFQLRPFHFSSFLVFIFLFLSPFFFSSFLTYKYTCIHTHTHKWSHRYIYEFQFLRSIDESKKDTIKRTRSDMGKCQTIDTSRCFRCISQFRGWHHEYRVDIPVSPTKRNGSGNAAWYRQCWPSHVPKLYTYTPPHQFRLLLYFLYYLHIHIPTLSVFLICTTISPPYKF